MGLTLYSRVERFVVRLYPWPCDICHVAAMNEHVPNAEGRSYRLIQSISCVAHLIDNCTISPCIRSLAVIERQSHPPSSLSPSQTVRHPRSLWYGRSGAEILFNLDHRYPLHAIVFVDPFDESLQHKQYV